MLVAFVVPAFAGDYPDKPVRILVGASAGGGTDLVARMLTQRLAERWNTNIIVDNRAGGAGIIAMNTVARAPADGYTAIISGNSFIMVGARRSVPYDIRATFDAVVQLTSQPYLVLVNSALPVRSVQELVAYVKQKPEGLNYGSSGTGSVIHLGVEFLGAMAGIKLTHVPYKGIGPAVNDAAAGHIQMLFANGIAAAGAMKSGRLKALAVTSKDRTQLFPNLPTVAESGLPGFELENMYGLYTPAGVPVAILARFNRDLSRIVNSPEIREKLSVDGAESAPPHTPAEFRARYLREIDKWEKFMKASGIKLGRALASGGRFNA